MIKLTHMTKYYVRSKPVITDLNLTFSDTGFVAILGKSGCGKTTLLNILGGIDLDYIGSVEFDDKEMQKASHNDILTHRSHTTSFIYQKGSLFDNMTVKQNLEIVLNMQNKKANIKDMLEKVGLSGYENKKVKELSGGEKQRVAIARSLLKDSKVILADEPTSALDSKNAHRILALLKEISKDKLVIIVSHDVKKVMMYVDRAIKFVDGAVEEDKIVNEVTGEVKPFKKRLPKKRTLLPILLNQLRSGFVINLFVVILLSLVLIATTLAYEQKPILKEYQDETSNNIDRILATEVINNINYFNVVKNVDNKDMYEYFFNVRENDELLKYPELDMTIEDVDKRNEKYNEDLRNYKKAKKEISDIDEVLEGFNYDIYDTVYKNIIIEGISRSLLKIEENTIDGKLSWREVSPTNFGYRLYNENNFYDLKYGTTPKNESETMITDTVAINYLVKEDIYSEIVDGKKVYNIEDMIGQNITIGDINATIDSFNYYKKTTLKVVGIINTNQLNYYEYLKDGLMFRLLSSFEKQNDDDTGKYLNDLRMLPYGYVVLHEHLKGKLSEVFYYNKLTFDKMTVEGIDIDGGASYFTGTVNYKNGETREDNLLIDYSGRIEALSSDIQGRENLKENEIIVTDNFLEKLYPNRKSYTWWGRENPPTTNDWINSFETGSHLGGNGINLEPINGRIINITFKIKGVDTAMPFKIVGIAASRGGTSCYISSDIYDTLLSKMQEEPSYAYTISLQGMDVEKRKEVIKYLYEEDYLLSPRNDMPGAFLEFTKTQGEIIKVDEWGDETRRNISLYNLFSEYYDNDSSKIGNSVLDIINNFYNFSLAMGIMISLGLIYLKERRQKDNISRLSLLGVKEGNMFFIQSLVYVVMGIVIFFITTFVGEILINVINNLFVYEVKGIDAIGVVKRIRIMSSNVSIKIGIIGGLFTIASGFIASIISIKTNKK